MATPTEHVSRDYEAYLTAPADTAIFNWGTLDAYRGGVQFLGRISVFPSPVDNESDDFGIMVGGGFTVEIADDADLSDWFIGLEAGGDLLLESGDRILLE